MWRRWWRGWRRRRDLCRPASVRVVVVVCAAQGRLKFIIGQVILPGDHDELLEHVDGQLRWLALVDDACGDRVDDGVAVGGHLLANGDRAHVERGQVL